jgi:hypothetical protein
VEEEQGANPVGGVRVCGCVERVRGFLGFLKISTERKQHKGTNSKREIVEEKDGCRRDPKEMYVDVREVE